MEAWTTPDIVTLALLLEGRWLESELEAEAYVHAWAGLGRHQLYSSLQRLLHAGLIRRVGDTWEAAAEAEKLLRARPEQIRVELSDARALLAARDVPERVRGVADRQVRMLEQELAWLAARSGLP